MVDDPLIELRERLAAIEARLDRLEGRRPTPKATQKPPPIPSRNLETLIGAHWLNRIGIAAVLVGAAYFLKYAFENNWVGPVARVSVGIAVGIAILVWSERFPQLFSYSLKVVGVGILYLSIWAASEMYA